MLQGRPQVSDCSSRKNLHGRCPDRWQHFKALHLRNAAASGSFWSPEEVLFACKLLIMFPATEKRGCMGSGSSLLHLVLFHLHEKTVLPLQLCFQHSRSYTLHRHCWSCGFRLTHTMEFDLWKYLGHAWVLYLNMLYHVSQKHSHSL